MAREPQRSEQPRPLGAAIVPLQRALIERAKVLDATSERVPPGHPDERCAEVYAYMASEFRALARELEHW